MRIYDKRREERSKRKQERLRQEAELRARIPDRRETQRQVLEEVLRMESELRDDHMPNGEPKILRHMGCDPRYRHIFRQAEARQRINPVAEWSQTLIDTFQEMCPREVETIRAGFKQLGRNV